MKFIGKNIAIGGVLVREIAEKFGTPTYVYDEEKIRKNFRKEAVSIVLKVILLKMV